MPEAAQQLDDESDFIPITEPKESFDDSDFIPVNAPKPEPDMAPLKQYFEENLKKPTAEGKPREATDIWGAIEAGWQMSVAGLATRQKSPDVVLPENASMAANIASGIASIAGDLPAIIPGFFAGAAGGAAAGGSVGSVVPGVGTAVGGAVGGVVGAGAGANALPAAVRSYLMDRYEKGEFNSFRDFWERASGMFIETLKQGTIGAAASGAGLVVGRVAGPAISKVAVPTTEIATMTTVGSALEGEIPNAEDFTAAGLMVATIHGLTKIGVGGSKHVSQKMRKIYAETGIKPEQVVEEARNNPILQQELLTENQDIPHAYKDLAEKPAESSVSMNDVMNEPVREITPDHPAVKAILENVEDAPKATKKGYSFSKAYTDFIDRLNPIKEADPQSYVLARMANDYKAKVKHFIERGTVDFKTLQINGKGFREIVEPFKDNLREFEAFLISKRALDYEKRGIHAGFDMDAAREVIKMGEKKYGSAAKELVEFQRRVLEYAKDSGLVSEKSFEAMIDRGQAYIPLKRILEPDGFENVRTKGGALKRVKGVEEGADIKTASPILSILENTQSLMRLAEKNRAVVDFVSRNEGSGLIEKVSAKSRAIQVTEAEVSRFFEENGIKADAEAFNIFRPNTIKLAENEFEVVRNGKREVFRTTKELAEAWRSLDGDASSMNILMRLARGITTLKRIGITLTPEFITRNFLRDQMMSAATSRGNVIPFVDVLVAMGDLVKKNDAYYNWLKSGGAQGAFLELNDRYLMKDVFRLQKSTGMLESTWNVVKKQLDAALAAAHIVELAPRLAEFKKVSGGAASGKRVFEGGFAAREVTLDFQRMGAKMSAYNAITAFTNATIQGADKAVRALKEDPAGVGFRAAAYITTPSILLWWANKDDPRVEAIPRWEKDLYWIIPTDNWVTATAEDHAEFIPEHLKRVVGDELQINKGVVYRIPKPHEFGVLFGSLPERLLEAYFKENPRAFKGFDETVRHMLTPSLVPDAVAPGLEQWANKNMFTGRDMIPFHLEKVAPEYQFTDYTSDSARQLSKLVGHLTGPDRTVSPIIIDNYIRQWSGTWGQYAVQMADSFLTDKAEAEKSLSEIPAIKAFVVRYPGSNAQQITDFYDRKKQIDQRMATIKHLSKQAGMEEELDAYMESTAGESVAMLGGTEKALSNSRKVIQAINRNPDFTPREKRQLIDGQYFHMIEAAKMAMQIADELDKQMAQAETRMKQGE